MFGSNIKKYRKNLVFIAIIKLKSIELKLGRSGNISFEFHNGKNIVTTSKYQRVTNSSFKTNLSEIVEVPFQIFYDLRKKRFQSHKIKINIINNHTKFIKKIGSVLLNISQILNSKLIVSNEHLKINGNGDKHSFLNLGVKMNFKGEAEEIENMDFSYFSITSVSDDNDKKIDLLPKFLFGKISGSPRSVRRSSRSLNNFNVSKKQKSFELKNERDNNYTSYINFLRNNKSPNKKKIDFFESDKKTKISKLREKIKNNHFIYNKIDNKNKKENLKIEKLQNEINKINEEEEEKLESGSKSLLIIKENYLKIEQKNLKDKNLFNSSEKNVKEDIEVILDINDQYEIVNPKFEKINNLESIQNEKNNKIEKINNMILQKKKINDIEKKENVIHHKNEINNVFNIFQNKNLDKKLKVEEKKILLKKEKEKKNENPIFNIISNNNKRKITTEKKSGRNSINSIYNISQIKNKKKIYRNSIDSIYNISQKKNFERENRENYEKLKNEVDRNIEKDFCDDKKNYIINENFEKEKKKFNEVINKRNKEKDFCNEKKNFIENKNFENEFKNEVKNKIFEKEKKILEEENKNLEKGKNEEENEIFDERDDLSTKKNIKTNRQDIKNLLSDQKEKSVAEKIFEVKKKEKVKYVIDKKNKTFLLNKKKKKFSISNSKIILKNLKKEITKEIDNNYFFTKKSTTKNFSKKENELKNDLKKKIKILENDLKNLQEKNNEKNIEIKFLDNKLNKSDNLILKIKDQLREEKFQKDSYLILNNKANNNLKELEKQQEALLMAHNKNNEKLGKITEMLLINGNEALLEKLQDILENRDEEENSN